MTPKDSVGFSTDGPGDQLSLCSPGALFADLASFSLRQTAPKAEPFPLGYGKLEAILFYFAAAHIALALRVDAPR
jgi:hypothetical protein